MILVENLSFQYPGNSDLTLEDVSFEVSKGEIFGFLGPSGSGKSTTQKILYRLLEGYSGKVTYDGSPLDRWDNRFYEKIGVSFELPNHYLKLTAVENLRFFASFYKKNSSDLSDLLSIVGLLDDAEKRVSEYSKGMKMRLNFIRALLHDPDTLFLDEPTSGMDPVNARMIKDHILHLKSQGKTIFLTTHNMFDADHLCDHIALLHQGKIRAIDKPDVLKLKYGSSRVKVTYSDPAGEDVFDLSTLGADETFAALLKENRIKTIHSEEATLEDVFIKITGDSLI